MISDNSIKFFDKSDIHFCNDVAWNNSYTEIIKDHTLMYIYSGKLTLWAEGHRYELGSRECVFIRKGSIVKTEISISEENDKPFHAAYIRLKKGFLRQFFRTLNDRRQYSDCTALVADVFKVDTTPDIKSLFISFIPYYDRKMKPTPLITNLKLKAGIYSLLNMQIGFYSILFDFKGKWYLPWIELF